MAFAAIAIVAPAADNSEGMGSSTTSNVTPTPIQYQEQKVSGIAVDNVDYQSNQKIIVNEGETWEIGDDTHQILVTIAGELEVPEGSTILIKSGSTLRIIGDMIVGGTVLAEENQGLMTLVEDKAVEFKVTETAPAAFEQFTDVQYKDKTAGKIHGYTYSNTGNLIEMPGFLEIAQGGTAIFANDVSFDGMFYVNGGSVAILESDFKMGSESYLKITSASKNTETAFIVDENSALTVTGYLSASFERSIEGIVSPATTPSEVYSYWSGIDNLGSVVIYSDKPAKGQVIVNLLNDDAVVSVLSLVLKSTVAIPVSAPAAPFVVTDQGLQFYEKKNEGGTVTTYFVDNVNYNMIKLGTTSAIAATDDVTISGIVIGESVTSKDVAKPVDQITGEDAKGAIAISATKSKVFTNTMVLAGDVDIAVQSTLTTVPNYTLNVDVTANREAMVMEDTELDFNLFTKLTIANGSIFKVAGTVDASAYDTSGAATIANSGKIILEGAGVLSYDQRSVGTLFTGNVLAAEIVLEKGKVNSLMTIDAALATDMSLLDVKTITLKGSVAVTTDSILASGVELNIPTGEIVLTINAGKTLTIEDGAKVKGSGAIVVNGTMYAFNASNVGVTDARITCDVKSQETNEKGAVVKYGWAQWDNLKSALDSAVPGSKITVTKAALTIGTSITIPAGVILDIPASTTTITVTAGTQAAPTTITVNGALQVAYPMSVSDSKAWGTEAKIIVNGFFLTDKPSATAGAIYAVSGAYYTDDETNKIMITTLSNAVATEVGEINVYGTVSESSAITAGEEQTINVMTGTLTVSDLTIAKKIDVKAGATLSGKISSEKGVLQVSGYTGVIEAKQQPFHSTRLVMSLLLLVTLQPAQQQQMEHSPSAVELHSHLLATSTSPKLHTSQVQSRSPER